MTTSAHVVDVKGNLFWKYVLLYTFRCHSFKLFSELKRRNPPRPSPLSQKIKKTGINRVNKRSPVPPSTTATTWQKWHPCVCVQRKGCSGALSIKKIQIWFFFKFPVVNGTLFRFLARFTQIFENFFPETSVPFHFVPGVSINFCNL